jgi:hypothetical protein
MAMLQQNPTCLLRESDTALVVSQYLAGNFIYPTTKLVLQQTPTQLLEPVYDTDPRAGIYAIKDKSGNKLTMASTNQQLYELYTKNGETVSAGGKCQICHTEFTTPAMGIVIHLNRLNLVDHTGRFHSKLEAWMDGCMDTMECVLYATRQELAKCVQYRNCNEGAERYLHEVFHAMYPHTKEVLMPCNDPSLLINNGGSLTYEQWNKSGHEYQHTGHLVTIPGKRAWVRLEYGTNTMVLPARDPMISK